MTYEIIGGDVAWQSANQTSVIVTPSRSSYLLNAGPVVVNMTFLSPVEASVSSYYLTAVNKLQKLAGRPCEDVQPVLLYLFDIYFK